jgi:predicted Zn-ribbon and HTH transcriptional regulator
MSDPANLEVCRECGYKGAIETFPPAVSVYSDVRCPECGSTNNQHNSDYLKDLMEKMKD